MTTNFIPYYLDKKYLREDTPVPGIMQEGVFITPQEAMEPVRNETLIYHESKPSPKALKSSLAFHNR